MKSIRWEVVRDSILLLGIFLNTLENSCNPIILRVHPADFFSHPTEYIHPLLAHVAWDYCFDPLAQDSRSLEATKDPFAADGDAVCLDVGRGLVQ